MHQQQQIISKRKELEKVNQIDTVKKEWVLLVPPKLVQSSCSVLVRAGCVSLPWHLGGRCGRRIYKYDEELMAIPLSLSKDAILKETTTELNQLLAQNGVRFLYNDYYISSRQRDPPFFDARIHPERAPTNEKNPGNDSMETNCVSSSNMNNNNNNNEELIKNRSATPDQKMYSYSQNQINSRKSDDNNSDSSEQKSVPAFTYAELFAGIGGFGVALEALGGRCVFCSEIDPICCQIYAQNFLRPPDATSTTGNTTNDNDNSNSKTTKDHQEFDPTESKIMRGDITKVPDDDLPRSLDILVGGFPCQPFSTLGTQPGFDCPKQHGTLFLQIVRFLNVSQPAAFLLENVPGLLGMEPELESIVSALERAGRQGYDVTIEVCNARGLTATKRKRLYLVGLRRKLSPTPSSSHLKQSRLFKFPYVPDLELRARNVLDYNAAGATSNGDYDHETETDTEILRITDEQLDRLNSEKRYRLAWPNLVCNTLVSHYGIAVARGHSQLVPLATGNPRRFSPRECARIMGFPNSFRLSLPSLDDNDGDNGEKIYDGGIDSNNHQISKKDSITIEHVNFKINTSKKKEDNKSMAERQTEIRMARIKQQYRMIGNAVCPPLVAAIAGAVLSYCPDIEGYENHTDWTEWGRSVAIEIAHSATINHRYHYWA